MAAKQTATLAGGCFWCIEGAFQRIRGVEKAISGYIDGHVKNPSYEAVCSGSTGHAEAVQLTFDPSVVSYRQLLDVFFTIHDPTTLNRQGNDVGTQYRSGIYYHSDEQKDAAKAVISELQGKTARAIVTEVKPASQFYPAEEYHQQYYEKNPFQGYCRAVVRPKIEKTETYFRELLK